MLAVGRGGRRLAGACGALEGAGLPVVGAVGVVEPGRERDEEVTGEAVDVRLVHAPQQPQLLVGVVAFAQGEAGARERRAQPREVFDGEAAAAAGLFTLYRKGMDQ